ncbi:hypothetical protein PMAYCL1PPCAC_28432, partial [Pristionchus mayeri]
NDDATLFKCWIHSSSIRTITCLFLLSSVSGSRGSRSSCGGHGRSGYGSGASYGSRAEENGGTAGSAAVLKLHRVRGGGVGAEASRSPGGTVGVLINAASVVASSSSSSLSAVTVAETTGHSAVLLSHLHRVAGVRAESGGLPACALRGVVASALGASEAEKGGEDEGGEEHGEEEERR